MTAPAFLFEDVARLAGAVPPVRPYNGTALFSDVSVYAGILWAGTGSIAGTVKRITTPVPRLVRLVHRASGKVVRQTMSGGDGIYRFDRVKTGVYFTVYAVDTQPGGFNAAIADYVLAT